MKMKVTLTIVTAFLLSATAFAQGSAENKTDAKGLKQGHWIKKDAAGKIIYEGQFKDDKPYGEFKYYYNTGELKVTSNFSDAGKTTRSKMYYTNGKKKAEGKYVDEQKDSVWKFYSDAELLLKEENYSKGKKNGTFKAYNEDGSLAKEENWKMDVKEGSCKEWYEKDHLKSETNYVNGIMEGKTTYYYPSGIISATGNYKKGIKDGAWKYTQGDGKSGSQDLYVNGVIKKSQRDNGEFEEYYPKSNILKATYTYANSKKNGAFKEYYEAGEWKIEVVPAHDEFPEEQRQYFEGEKIQRSGNYKDNNLDGKIVYFKLDGTIEKTEMYVNGVLQKNDGK